MKTITVVFVIAISLLIGKYMDVAVKPNIQVRVDTLRLITKVYDTVTVISRAKDTVRIRIKDVGPLTEQDVARLVCDKDEVYGDQRDVFEYNQMGAVHCPKNGLR